MDKRAFFMWINALAHTRMHTHISRSTEPPIIHTDGGVANVATEDLEIDFKAAEAGCTILFTIDGSTPTNESFVFDAPFKLTKTGVIGANS